MNSSHAVEFTGAIEFEVYVRPGVRRPSIGGCHDDVLVVRTSAQPVEGQANDAVHRSIAEAFDVRASSVSIVRGATSRRKRIRVEGDPDRLATRLTALRSAEPR